MDRSYDLLIVGSGPGGYVAAIRASQLNMRLQLLKKKIWVVFTFKFGMYSYKSTFKNF